MRKSHVLLDSECASLKNEEFLSDNHREDKKYILQVFTQPVFDKNTLFFELIQRVGDVQGFGAANIKALWNAVEHQLEKNNTSKNMSFINSK